MKCVLLIKQYPNCVYMYVCNFDLKMAKFFHFRSKLSIFANFDSNYDLNPLGLTLESVVLKICKYK